MVRKTKVLDVVWATVNLLSVLRHKIANRSATEDARRAQNARLFWLQAGPPIGSCPWQDRKYR